MSCHCPATNWYDGKGHNPGCPLYELEQAPEIIRAAKEITELALIETDYLYVKTIEILKRHKYCARKCGDYAAEGKTLCASCSSTKHSIGEHWT